MWKDQPLTHCTLLGGALSSKVLVLRSQVLHQNINTYCILSTGVPCIHVWNINVHVCILYMYMKVQCMYIYVIMYVCACTCTCMYACIYMYILYFYMYMYVYMLVHLCYYKIHVCILVHYSTCMYVGSHICTCVCTCTCTVYV